MCPVDRFLTAEDSNSSESLALLPSPDYTFDSFQYMPTPDLSACFPVTSTPNSTKSPQDRKQETTIQVPEKRSVKPIPARKAGMCLLVGEHVYESVCG